MAFPLSCWIALAGFLGCLSLFGLAVTRVVAPSGAGHSRGFFGGLAALLALFFFGGLGVLGLGAAVVAIGIGSVAHWNPVRRIEIERAPAVSSSSRREDHDDELRTRVTLRADTGGELARFLRDTVHFEPHASAAWTSHRIEEGGEPFDVYELRLPVSEHDLERFERDLEREIDGLDLRLPRKIDVELGPPDPR